MVHIGGILEVVCVEFVVLRSIGIGMVVVLDMIQMVVDMVYMSYVHMELNGDVRLASMTCGYIEEWGHMHMMIVVNNHNKGHHTHWTGTH